MFNSRPYRKILSLVIVTFLIFAVFGPAFSLGEKRDNVDLNSNQEVDLKATEDNWYIDGTEYINGSIEGSFVTKDYNIVINSSGKLKLNNVTLALTLDKYHPWEIIVNGGELVLWNSTIQTQPDDSTIRPFLKTKITAKNSAILKMRMNSSFSFPGWVIVDNSELDMKESSFSRLPNINEYRADYNEDGVIDWPGLDKNDNDDCPFLISRNDSKIYIEDSQIRNYYENNDLSEMSWYPSSLTGNTSTTGNLTAFSNPGENYNIEAQESLEIDKWNLSEPVFPASYPYINPFNRLSSLYIEINYKTETNYSSSSVLEYYNGTDWNEAINIDKQDTTELKYDDIWEIDLDSFNKNNGDYLKNLTLNLTNTNIQSESAIQIEELRLVSSIENDFDIRDSQVWIINSYLDVDFNASDIDPRMSSTHQTNQTTWLEDSIDDTTDDHTVLRLYNSSLKAYGLRPTDENTPDSDPIVITDKKSNDRVWIYRWVHLTVESQYGSPIDNAIVNLTSRNDITKLNQQAIENSKLINNKFAWDYLNRTGKGEYIQSNNTYTTNENGEVTLLLVSDRINHPKDWPNSLYLGNYYMNVSFEEYNDTQLLNLSAFPQMSESDNHKQRTVKLDIPLPDLHVDEKNLTVSPSEVTIGDNVTISTTIYNLGGADVNNVNFTFYLDDISNQTIIETYTLSLTENGNVSIELNWTPQETGDFVIMGVLDPLNETKELNENNNIATAPLSVLTKPDLLVYEIFVDPANDVVNGTDVDISAGVANIGGTNVTNANITFYYDSTVITSVYMDIPSNSDNITTPINWDYSSLGTGEYNITAEIDPENTVDENDETNNNITELVTINSNSTLDPTLTVSDNVIMEGQTLEIIANFTNNGGWPSESVEATFYVDKGESTEEIIDSVTVSSVEPGETSNDYYITWTAEISGNQLQEDRDISVSLGSPYDVSDSEIITVYKPAALSVNEEDVTFSTDELSQVGESLLIEANVHNTGGEDVTTDVSFFDGLPTGTNMIAQNTVTINSNSSITTNVSWNPQNRGNHDIYVVVDYQNNIVENDKSDNQVKITKPIFSENYRFDLIVDDDNSPREITGTYGINGFTVVEEGGTLRITGDENKARFEMIMDRDNQFSIIVRDNAELIMDNALLYSDYNFNVYIEDDGRLETLSDSRVYSMAKLDSGPSTTLNFRDSVYEGEMEISSQLFEARESDFPSSNIFLQPSRIECINVSFEDNLVDFEDTKGNLTAVETDSIEMTGDSEINIYRWLEATTTSSGGLPIKGADIQASNLIYSTSSTTNNEGKTNLRLLTDVLTSNERNFVGNYEISASYQEETQSYEIDPITIKLPNYPSDEYIRTQTLVFENLFIPDLEITSDRVSANPSEVTAGEMVTLYAEVHNAGETEAEQVQVTFKLGNTTIGSDTIISISEGGYGTASVEWEATMTDEELKEEIRNIDVVVNTDVLPLDDANVGNNEASLDVTVKSPPRLEFSSDLRIYLNGEPLGDRNITERDQIGINVIITNSGGTGLTNASLEFKYDNTQIAQNITDIDSGESINITQPWLIKARGQQDLMVWFNSSAEDPTYSVSISKQINIKALKPVFTNIQVPQTDQGTREVVPIRGKLLRESDEKPISGVTVTAYLLRNGNTVSQATAKTGNDGSFIIQMVTPDSSGDYTVAIEADHPESERTDTQQSISVVGAAEEGIPLWIILVIIAAIAAASIIGIFLYLRTQEEGEWVECGNCGATIPADSTECPKCGVEFEMETVKCSECGEWIPAEAENCPHCGAEFITTGTEVKDYEDRMREQYDEFVEQQKEKAEEELGIELDDDEFMNWWEDQPSYVTFDEWLEREEVRRKEGGIECPECGAINSMDDAICQKCGTTLIQLEPEKFEEGEEGLEEELEELEGMEDFELDEDMMEGMEPEEEEETVSEAEEETVEKEKETSETAEEKEEEKPEKKVRKKKVKKKPKKVVKKKVKKKEEDEE